MPILDFNDPNPGFGGGGGGGGGSEGFTATEIDTDLGSGMDTLPSLSAATEGHYYLYTLSNPSNSAMLLADGFDTINGQAALAVGVGESVLLQVGATEWEVVAVGPEKVRVELASGGDIYVLPQLSTVPAYTTVIVIYNDPGTSDPVEVQPYAGDTFADAEFTGYIFDLYDSVVLYSEGFQWRAKVKPVAASFSPTYALEYALVNGGLISGSELSVHQLNCSTPSDATITSLSVTGAGWVTPPSVFLRGARSHTNVFGGGPLVMSPAGITAPNNNRSVEIVFKLTDARTQAYVALAQIGTFSTNECFGIIRASTDNSATQAIDFQAGAGNAGGTGNIIPMWSDTSLIQNLWCYVCITYDSVIGEYTAYWWADGDGAFSSDALAFANAGTGTAQPIYLGGNGSSFYTWPGEYAYIALHNTVLSSDYRDTMVALLGLS